MSVFSAFRSAAVEVLHLNSTSWVLRSMPCSTSILARTPGRSFHISSTNRAWVKNTQTNKTEGIEADRKAKERKRKEIGLRDRDIPYKKVQVSSSEGLSAFRPLADVISEVEHKNALDALDSGSKQRYHAQLIANDPTPIVKIVDFKEEFKKQKEARERAKNNAAQNVRKEVQLTWSSSQADVDTKLAKVKEDLERGYKVDLVITPKKGVRSPRLEDMKERTKEFITHFAGIAKEWKGQDFTKSTLVIYLQGTATPSVAAKQEETNGIPKKILLKEQRKQKEAERLRRKKEQEAEIERKYSDTKLPS